MFHIMRSVIFGLVADGVISRMPFLLVDFRGTAMVTPELKWPDYELDRRRPTNLLATETALLGIGNVVAVAERDLLAEDAAGRVDVRQRPGQLPFLSWRSERLRFGPVIGPTTTHLDLRRGRARERNSKNPAQGRAW